MARQARNYKKELEAAKAKLAELKGDDVEMHMALATQDYDKIEDISDKVLVELLNSYISMHEMYDNQDLIPEDFEDEEDLIYG